MWLSASFGPGKDVDAGVSLPVEVVVEHAAAVVVGVSKTIEDNAGVGACMVRICAAGAARLSSPKSSRSGGIRLPAIDRG